MWKLLLNCSFCIISQEQGNYEKKVEQPKIELQNTKFINEYSKLLSFREIGWDGNCERPIPQVMHLMAEKMNKALCSNLFIYSKELY